MTTTAKYPPRRIALHWLMVLLLVGVYAAINLADFFPKGSATRGHLKTWHFMLGLSVLGLVVGLLARWMQPGPPDLAAPAGQLWLARFIHWALYIFMIACPWQAG